MSSSCCVWDIRSNAENWTTEELINWCKEHCKKWVFQLEEGDSGYKHYQGRINLIKKRQKHIILELCNNKFNYLAPTSKDNYKDEFFYAMKKDTRIEGPFSNDDKNDNYIPRQYRGLTLYDWQLDVLKSKDEFNSRTINLIYDANGNNGKSTVAAIGELEYGGIDMPPLNDFKELIALACCICMDRNIRDPKLMFFDMPRAMSKDRLYGIYTAIEQIKKGKLYDVRYHYKYYWIDSPQIWVFSNHLPDETLLSNDRWVIWTIGQDKKLHKYKKEIEFIKTTDLDE